MQKKPLVSKTTLIADYTTTNSYVSILTIIITRTGWWELSAELNCYYVASNSVADVLAIFVVNSNQIEIPRFWKNSSPGAGLATTAASSLNFTEGPIYLSKGDEVAIQVKDTGSQHAVVLGTAYKSQFKARYL